jgi:uncharacterized membrane protein
VVLVAPLLIAINGHDGVTHRNWIQQFTDQFQNGNWYPRWLSESYSGFGSPVFYFYPPFSYHAAGLLSLIGITEVPVLFHLIAYICLVISFFTARAYFKTLTANVAIANFAAFVYALAPYRSIDLYIRSAWSEYMVFAWLPLVFLCAERFLSSTNIRELSKNTIFMAGAVALVLVTNIPTAVIILPAVVLYLLCIAPVKHYVRLLLASGAATIFGFVFAGMFTFPLVALRSEIPQTGLWKTFFESGFVGYIVTVALQPNTRVFGVFLVLLIAGSLWLLIILLRQRSDKASFIGNRQRAFAVLLFCVIFLQIPVISEPFYSLQPFRYIQFAFRWDIIGCLAFAGAVVTLYPFAKKKALLIGCITLLTSALMITVVKVKFGDADGPSSLGHLTKSDPPEYLSVHTTKSPDFMEEFYLTKSINTFEAVSGFTMASPKVQLLSKTPDQYVYQINAIDTGTIAITLQHFATWEAFRDGSPIASSYDEYGRRLIPIAKGDYTISVVRLTTDAEKFGLYSTLTGIVAIGCVAVFGRKKKAKGSLQTPGVS